MCIFYITSNVQCRLKRQQYSIIDAGAPFSLIKYEAEIEISDNLDDYEKAKTSQKALDATPSP